MRKTRTFAALGAATATVLLTAVPADAALTPGARYDGTGGKPALYQVAKASKDGKRLAKYTLLASNGKCSDGKRWDGFINQVREKPTVIKADGSFDHPASDNPADARSLVVKRGKKRYRGRIFVGFTGTSSADGGQVTATVTARFTAKRLRCRARSTTTLYRDGTPGAPFAGPLVNTGAYPAAETAGFTLGSFKAFAPGGELRGVDVKTAIKCQGIPAFDTKFTYKTLYLSPRGRATVPSLVKGRTKDGYRYVSTDVLKLRFFRRGAQYAYSGTYSAKLVYKRGARTLKCKTPAKKFAAVLPAG